MEPANWEVQIQWNDRWVTVQRGLKTLAEANWATAQWKLANDCRKDPFRAVEMFLLTHNGNRWTLDDAEVHCGDVLEVSFQDGCSFARVEHAEPLGFYFVESGEPVTGLRARWSRNDARSRS